MKSTTVLGAKRLGIQNCSAQHTLRYIVQKMTEEDISCLVVVDADGYLEGIISRTDIVNAVLTRPDDWGDQPCRDWMTQDVIAVPPDATLEDAAQLLRSRHIHRIIVAQIEGDRQRPIAVISDSDIVYHLARRMNS